MLMALPPSLQITRDIGLGHDYDCRGVAQPERFPPTRNRRMYYIRSNGEMGVNHEDAEPFYGLRFVRVFLPRSSVLPRMPATFDQMQHAPVNDPGEPTSLRARHGGCSEVVREGRVKDLRMATETAALPPRSPPLGSAPGDGTS